MSQPAISRHLKVLEHAGLITRVREAQWRPARIDAEPLKEVADWVSQYRHFWDARFDSLASYLRTIQKRGKRNARKRRKFR